VLVTSRNREESSQEVPIPISVIGSQALVRDGTVQHSGPDAEGAGNWKRPLPNSRRTGISLRGIGKSAGNDALEASMGVLVDGVYLTHPGMTYQDFTDLESHRGPCAVHRGTAARKKPDDRRTQFREQGPGFYARGQRHVHDRTRKHTVEQRLVQ